MEPATFAAGHQFWEVLEVPALLVSQTRIIQAARGGMGRFGTRIAHLMAAVLSAIIAAATRVASLAWAAVGVSGRVIQAINSAIGTALRPVAGGLAAIAVAFVRAGAVITSAIALKQIMDLRILIPLPEIARLYDAF